MNADLGKSNLFITMSPKVEIPARDKFDLEKQQKKTIQMLQNYSKENGDKGRN